MPEMSLNPRDLVTPEIHAEIYGGKDDNESLVESIREHGILQNLIVTRFEPKGPYVVVSGCRRRDAALKLGMDFVPCTVVSDLKLAEFDLLVVENNRYRKKTNVQLANEFRVVRDRLASLPAGKRRAEAAKTIGIGINRAEMAAKVAEKIEELKESGQKDKAQELSEALNENIDAAHAAVAPPPVPASLRGVWETRELLKTALLAIRRAANYLGKAKGLPGAELMHCEELIPQLSDIAATMKAAMPESACEACAGAGCKRCQKRGWLTKEAVKRRPSA